MEAKPHILYILAINAGMWSFFSILQLNFQENNPLEFLKIFMFLAARQHIYSNSCTSIRYNNMHTGGKPPICCGVFRPLSGRYSKEENKLAASDIVDKIIVKMHILKCLKT